MAIKQLTSISQLSMGMADYSQAPAVQESGPFCGRPSLLCDILCPLCYVISCGWAGLAAEQLGQQACGC